MKNNRLIQFLRNVSGGFIWKKPIFILVLVIMSLGASANPPLASKMQIGLFKNSKTCVVLGNGSIAFSLYLKEAVEKYWNITEFEFIDQQEFDKRRYDSKYSFLVLMKASFDKDPGGVTYNYLSLVLGDIAPNLTNMPELCSIPLSYSDDNNRDFEYAIPAIVRFMQKHARNLEFNRFFISMKGLKFYNKSSSFKGKGLLLNFDMMATNANSPEKIKSAYPYYVKILTVPEITTELSSNPSNSLFLFHVGPTTDNPAGKCFEMIFDTEGNLYYYNSRKITNDNENGFNMKDFYAIR